MTSYSDANENGLGEELAITLSILAFEVRVHVSGSSGRNISVTASLDRLFVYFVK